MKQTDMISKIKVKIRNEAESRSRNRSDHPIEYRE